MAGTSGAMWTNIIALAWPQRESCSSCVSLLLRKGTCLVLRCASAAITSPSALRLRLMCLASSSLSPVASLLPTLSLPAHTASEELLKLLSTVDVAEGRRFSVALCPGNENSPQYAQAACLQLVCPSDLTVAFLVPIHMGKQGIGQTEAVGQPPAICTYHLSRESHRKRSPRRELSRRHPSAS